MAEPEVTIEQIEDALAKFNGLRDELVKAAWWRGISKHRIYCLSGIARTTIDRILVESLR
jgi:hypothetical protein